MNKQNPARRNTITNTALSIFMASLLHGGLDGADNLWVSTSAGFRALKYDSAGTFRMSIGTAGLRIAAEDLLARGARPMLDARLADG